MALCTLHASAEEELRHVLHLLLHVLHLTIPGDRRMLVEIPGGGDDFAHELVVGLVVRDAVANPREEEVAAACIGGLGALIAQQAAPFIGKVLGVFRAVEEAVDQGAAFPGVLRSYEVLHLCRRGQAAADVEGDAADEGAVIGDV